MRDILFRGKREDNGEWVYGYPLIDTAPCSLKADGKCVCPHDGSDALMFCWDDKSHEYNSVDVIPETIGQYTSLSDSNVLEIFEGDCIKMPDYEEIGVIRYGKYRQPCDEGHRGHIGFYVDWVHGNSKDYLRKDLGYWADSVEIIGNIHDNPESLSEAVM